MEADRPWEARHDGLAVETQRTLTVRRRLRHPYGFRDEIYVHIPYDTLRRLSRIEPDTILSDELGVRTAQALIYRHIHRRTRLIIWATVSEHSENGRSLSRRLLRTVLLPRADAVVVNGASGARYIKGFGIADKKIFVAPQTTEHRRFAAIPLERSTLERRRLTYVGRLIQLKNLIPFLSMLASWCKAHPKDAVEFRLAGDGPELVNLRRVVAPPNLQIHFSGNIAFEDLPAFYAQAGIFVFPTLADTWGLVVNEAMAAGLPVLGSTHSQAVEELVKDGENGWTFQPNHPGEVYAALDRALTTSFDRLMEMGATSRKAVEHLTPEFAAQRIMDAIRFVRREMPNEGASAADIASARITN